MLPQPSSRSYMEATLTTNENNTYSVSELNYLRESIEAMNKFNQLAVLRILHKHKDVMLNENKYGTHINISDLKTEILDELSLYVKYVNDQEINLHHAEQQKTDFFNAFFTSKDGEKDIKDKTFY